MTKHTLILRQIVTIAKIALVQWGAATVFWLGYVYIVQVICILVLRLGDIARLMSDIQTN